MYCKNCGAEIKDTNAKFCEICGNALNFQNSNDSRVDTKQTVESSNGIMEEQERIKNIHKEQAKLELSKKTDKNIDNLKKPIRVLSILGIIFAGIIILIILFFGSGIKVNLIHFIACSFQVISGITCLVLLSHDNSLMVIPIMAFIGMILNSIAGIMVTGTWFLFTAFNAAILIVSIFLFIKVRKKLIIKKI